MHKTFLLEFIIASGANLTLFNQLFTIDFIKTLLIVCIQFILTLLVRLIFDKITKNKIKK